MKRILILLLILFSAPAFSQESLKARMDRIEKDFGVSFVYASSLSPESRTVLSNEYGDDLSGALASSFKGTGIRYKIHRGNVILSVDRSGKAAKSTVCGLVTDAGSGEILIGASVIVTRPGGHLSELSQMNMVSTLSRSKKVNTCWRYHIWDIRQSEGLSL